MNVPSPFFLQNGYHDYGPATSSWVGGGGAKKNVSSWSDQRPQSSLELMYAEKYNPDDISIRFMSQKHRFHECGVNKK